MGLDSAQANRDRKEGMVQGAERGIGLGEAIQGLNCSGGAVVGWGLLQGLNLGIDGDFLQLHNLMVMSPCS